MTVSNTEGGEVTVPETQEDIDWMNAPMGPKTEPQAWAPDSEDFLSLKGKAYLPARRRIQWMRGIPVAHPDWTIDTEIVTHDVGKRTGPGRVEGGYAVVRANIFDEGGRLIATGLKTEYSENFADYLEKAETGAIARALAVAGYGTESALDLDEGADAGRVADSPVEQPKPVTIGKSAVPGIGRGGKTDSASVAQIRRVSQLSQTLDLGANGLANIIALTMKGTLPTLSEDEKQANRQIADFLSEQSGEEVGALIRQLEAAATPVEA